MKCPACDVTLVMTDRQGIEIDYCPQCRGVWLDRGELDKLIERASADAVPPAPTRAAPPPPPHDPRAYGHGEQHRSDHYKSDQYKYKKKKNLLGELFDF